MKRKQNTFSNVDMDNIAYECDPCTLSPNHDPKIPLLEIRIHQIGIFAINYFHNGI